jgi:hypothetical protein
MQALTIVQLFVKKLFFFYVVRMRSVLLSGTSAASLVVLITEFKTLALSNIFYHSKKFKKQKQPILG